MLKIHSARLSETREAKGGMLTQSLEDYNDPELSTNLAMLENDIDEATYKASINPAIHLTDADKTERKNLWPTYR